RLHQGGSGEMGEGSEGLRREDRLALVRAVAVRAVVGPASARTRVPQVRAALVFLILELVVLAELLQQRLQAPLGGRVAVALVGETVEEGGGVLVVGARLDRPRESVGFCTFRHRNPPGAQV